MSFFSHPSPDSELGWHIVTLIKRCYLNDFHLEKLGGGASGEPDSPIGEENHASEDPEHRCEGGAGEPGAGAGVGRGCLLEGAPLSGGSGSPPLRAPGEAKQGNCWEGLWSCHLPRPKSARDREPEALTPGQHLELG